MNHINENQLKAFIDGEEIEGLTQDELERHLQQCQRCKAKEEELEAQKVEVQKRLEFLTSSSRKEVSLPSPQVTRKAYADFMRKIYDQQEESKMVKWLKPQFRVIGLAAFIIAVLILFLSFPSGKSWAGQFLGIFRVQQVKFVQMETNVLEEISGNSTLNQRLGEILSSSITVLREPDEPQEVADAQAASQLVGYPIRLPAQAATTPSIYVNGGSAFEMVIDRERVQAFLEEAGREDLVLPQSLNGAMVKVDIPRGVSALYGECPSVKKNDEQNPEEKRRVNYPDCIIFSIFASPTVTTPPDLDLAQLVQLGLEFSGWTTEDAQSFSQQIDWTSTLVIPIPKRDARVEQLSIDGVVGSLVLQETGYVPRYALIWTKDGIVYALHGWGIDPSHAIDMANSLPQG